MADQEDINLAQKLLDLEEQSKGNKEKEIEYAKELEKLKAKQIEQLLAEGKLTETLESRLKQIQATAEKTVGYYKTQVDNLQTAKDSLDAIIAQETGRYKNAVLMEERNKVAIAHRRAIIDQLKQQAKTAEGISAQQAKDLEKLQKLDDKLKTFGDAASDIAQNLFSGDASGITGALKNIAGSMKKDLTASIKNAVNGADDLGSGLKAARGAMGKLVLFEFVTAIAKLAVELGNAENAFMKATGASEDFARSISDTYEEGRKFTATAEDMSKSATSLFNSFTDFTYQDKQARDGLIKTGAVLEKLGVSNDDFAKSIQLSTKALGMSAEDAGQSMLDLEKYARELGVSPERLSGQFLEASDTLAKLGENGDEAFRDLAAAAKVTGLEVNKLLNIVNQFDTFEGAARQAGKLNAALGGNFVNAMDLMMETDPTARFEQIRDAILDTGLSFDSMSYYQKNFYKDALGLSDVGELALVLSGNMDSVSEATKKTSQEYEEAAKRAKTVASFQEQLNALFAQLIPIVTPIIDILRTLMTAISENIGAVKLLGGVLVAFGGIPGIVVAVMGLLDALKIGEERISALSLLMEGFMFPIEAMVEALQGLKNLFIDSFGGAEKFNEAMKELAPVIKVVGGIIAIALLIPLAKVIGVVGAVVLGIFAVGSAIAKLMGAFKKKNSPSFFDMFTGGLLAQSLELLLAPLNAFKAMLETIGGIFNSIMTSVVAFFTALTDPTAAANIEKIAAAIAEVPISNAFALGGAMADIGETLKIQASVGNNEVMNNSMETAAAAQPATMARAAATTAANTNISQTSSKTTYVNSGPETAVFDVRIGDEKLGRVVQKISNKNISNGITGRN